MSLRHFSKTKTKTISLAVAASTLSLSPHAATSRVDAMSERAVARANAQLADLKKMLLEMEQELEQVQLEMESGKGRGSIAKTISTATAGIAIIGNIITLGSLNARGEGAFVGVLFGTMIATAGQAVSSVANAVALYRNQEIPAQELARIIEDAVNQLNQLHDQSEGSEKIIMAGMIGELNGMSAALADGEKKESNALILRRLSTSAQLLGTLSAAVLATRNGAETASMYNLAINLGSNFAIILTNHRDDGSKEVVRQIEQTREKIVQLANQL